jgi:outer membrane protein assembly factor BamB
MLLNVRALTLQKICAAGLMYAMAASTPAQSSGPSAVTFQINPAHTGVTSFTTPLQLPLAQVWSLSFPSSVSYPLIVNGKVYVTYSNASSYGSSLIAIDENTGATVWGPIAIAGTYFSSYAAYDNGVIFVVNTDGLLRTYNADTGVAGWTLQLPNQYSFSSPPTATGGVVYISGSGSGGTLYAVGESSHTVLWSKPLVTGDDSSPAVGNGDVYVSFACVWVYSFLTSNGTPLWHNSTGCSGGGGNTPVLANGNLYVRDTVSTPAGYVFNAASGAALGRYDALTIPAIGAQTGYFLQTGKTLRAVSLADLTTVAWSFTGDGNLSSAPLVVNNLVFVGSSQGKLYALDTATGNIAWQTSVQSMYSPNSVNMDTAIGAGDNMLVVPTSSKLYGFKTDHIFADNFEGP